MYYSRPRPYASRSSDHGILGEKSSRWQSATDISTITPSRELTAIRLQDYGRLAALPNGRLWSWSASVYTADLSAWSPGAQLIPCRPIAVPAPGSTALYLANGRGHQRPRQRSLRLWAQ